MADRKTIEVRLTLWTNEPKHGSAPLSLGLKRCQKAGMITVPANRTHGISRTTTPLNNWSALADKVEDALHKAGVEMVESGRG